MTTMTTEQVENATHEQVQHATVEELTAKRLEELRTSVDLSFKTASLTMFGFTFLAHALFTYDAFKETPCTGRHVKKGELLVLTISSALTYDAIFWVLIILSTFAFGVKKSGWGIVCGVLSFIVAIIMALDAFSASMCGFMDF
jgi:hypothetical protein